MSEMWQHDADGYAYKSYRNTAGQPHRQYADKDYLNALESALATERAKPDNWEDWRKLVDQANANAAEAMSQLVEERATAEGLYRALVNLPYEALPKSQWGKEIAAADDALAAYRASHPQPATPQSP